MSAHASTESAITSRRPDLLAAALAAAARGWHVFPLRPGSKKPGLHGYDRCPRNGICAQRHQGWEQRATTDPDRIRAAWTGRAFNVGIAAGPSGLVVIDLDVPKPDDGDPPDWVRDTPGVRDGQDVFAVLAEQATGSGLTEETYTVVTPSGGLHLYYRAPAGVELRNTEGDRGRGLGWKVDTRAHGGYVVAAGSILESTGRASLAPPARSGESLPAYGGSRGEIGPAAANNLAAFGKSVYRVLDDRDPVELPRWLAERLTPAPPAPVPAAPIAPTRGGRSRYLDAAIHGETTKVLDAPASQRNASLYAAAVALGQLVAGDALTEAEVTEKLLGAASKHVALGAYSARQARQTIASGIRAGANRPRQVAA